MRAPESILVINTRRIGDLLLTTPLLHSLKAAWPSARLDVLVFKGSESVLAHNPDVNNLLLIDERPDWKSHWALLRRIWRSYDLAISTLSGDRPTLYAAWAGKKSQGLLIPERKQAWKQHLLSLWTPFDDRNTHTVRMYLALAEQLGIPAIPKVRIHWTPAQARRVDSMLEGLAPFAVLHVYPKYVYKMWHKAGWVNIGHWLQAQGLQVILTGSDDTSERACVHDLAKSLPGALDFSGQLNLNEIAYLLSKAIVFIGTDTSVTHIAAAVAVSTVTLMGPTNPVKWGAWPESAAAKSLLPSPWKNIAPIQQVGNVTLIQGLGDCVPCHKAGCEDHNESPSLCLQNLAPERVIAALEKLFAKNQTSDQIMADQQVEPITPTKP